MLTLFALLGTAHAGDLIIGAGQSGTFTCDAHQAVAITGSALKITLSGDCGAIHVVGASNVVTADGVAAIAIEGSSNTVTWKRDLSGAASLPVTRVGVGNKVRKA
jgi:hypothetical protein